MVLVELLASSDEGSGDDKEEDEGYEAGQDMEGDHKDKDGVIAKVGAAVGAAAPTAAAAGNNHRVFGPQLVLPPALQLLYDILTEHKQQQQERLPASVSQAQKDVLRKGRELVCTLDERVETFMAQLLVTPGVVLTGEGGGEKERALRKRRRVRVVREYLKMVEKGDFALACESDGE